MASRSLCLGIAILVAAGCSHSAKSQCEAREFQIDGAVVRCLVWTPHQHATEAKRWPLVLFLHGAGERGDDLDALRKVGLPKVLDGGGEFPFIVVAPQTQQHRWNPEELSGLLDQVMASYAIAPDRVYVTGLSMGGYGTWALAAAHPGRFAAAVPICGGGDPRWAKSLQNLPIWWQRAWKGPCFRSPSGPGLVSFRNAHIPYVSFRVSFTIAAHFPPEVAAIFQPAPIWAFHGAKDEVVPLSASEEMVRALEAAGGKVQFTVYPDAEHDCWSETYDNPHLYEWLLRQRRESAQP